MVTTEKLETIFKKIGNTFGFESIDAEYAPFRDLKIKWVRTINHASFSVSDYLEEAPEGVIEDIATGIMMRIRGDDFEGYSEEAKEWLTSHEFRASNQEKYVERSRSIDIDPENTDRLWEAYYRLVDEGLISEIDDLRLFWSKSESVSKAGQSSSLMRIVIMNKRLLDTKVPEEVLDYCLLHELANITIPFGLDNIERKKEVNEVTNGFVGAETAKKWLDQVMMEV